MEKNNETSQDKAAEGDHEKTSSQPFFTSKGGNKKKKPSQSS